MQCSCGDETKDHKAVKAEKTLTYQRCKSCGRQGAYLYYIGEKLIESGEYAKTLFDQST